MRKLKERGEAHGQRREQRSAVPVHQGGAWLGAVVESNIINVTDGAEQLARASQAPGGSNQAMRARKHISATGSAPYATHLLCMDKAVAVLLSWGFRGTIARASIAPCSVGLDLDMSKASELHTPG